MKTIHLPLYGVLCTFFLLVIPRFGHAQTPQNLTQDSLALVDLYLSTGGRSWAIQDGWLSAAPLETWFGVQTDLVNDELRVSAIELPDNNLSGAVPESFAQLTGLQSVVLSDNRLTIFPDILDVLDELNALLIDNNLLTLEDIVPLVLDFQQLELPIDPFTFIPQKPQDTIVQRAKVGQEFVLRTGVDENLDRFDVAPLQYEWFRNGIPAEQLEDFRSDPALPELVFLEMDTVDTATYVLNISIPGDNTYEGLVITVPVDVRALCEDRERGFCYTCGEMILTFTEGATNENIQAFLQKEKDEYNARVDSCLCGEDLFLLSYEDLGSVFLEDRRANAESMVDVESTELNIQKDNRYFPIDSVDSEKILPINLRGITGMNGQGNPVRIGLVDSGTEQFHPGLSGIFWRNPAERIDLADNDANCISDDSLGYDFVTERGYPDPRDNLGHGTHLAGILSANTPRDVELEIIDAKFVDNRQNSTLFEAACAIYYSIDNGAQVINLSWGYTGGPSDLLKTALDAADAADIVMITSAGNSRENNDLIPHWPSNYSDSLENLIAVAAVKLNVNNQYEFAAEFSNYGKETVDIAAPGTRIISTFLGSTYEELSGTSMAAAFVSRTVAHARAVRPDLPAEVIVNCVLNSGQPVPGLESLVSTGAVLLPTSALVCAFTDTEVVPERESPVSIYPQPFHQRLHLDLTKLTGPAVQFQLFNSVGQFLQSYQLPAGGIETIQLNGRALPPGFYIYTLETDGTLFTGRLLKH